MLNCDTVTLEQVFDTPPYSLDKTDKTAMLDEQLGALTRHHYAHCPEYRKMLDACGMDMARLPGYADLPFLPVRLFKELDLLSVPRSEVVKTMTSSGTTGQAVSKIYLDKATSGYQTRALTRIVSSFLGTQRVPMLILDSSEVVRDRAMFSARGAGILGFSIFGSKRLYALDGDMKLDIDGIRSFLEAHEGETIFLFGFTFMVWQHFYKTLLETGYRPDFSRGVLIHGGGWKKLIHEQVSPQYFRDALREVCGITRVHDYYGMVEQTGSIYMECEQGHLHAPVFSDVLIRRPHDFSLADVGEEGIIQVVSILPRSYPGHVLLTEDKGVILGRDDCPCGRRGSYFKINRRIKNAEIRGCSDTYATKFR